MKKFISPIIALFCLAFLLACVFSVTTKTSAETAKAQSQTSPTPPLRAVPEERAGDWEARKKKLLTAEFPLQAETTLDADGDGKPDKILYRIKPWKEDFEGLLKITSAQNKVLWEHEFFMSSRDLAKFLDEVLGYESVKNRVDNVFNPNQDYSFKALQEKIKESDLDSRQIDYAAKLHKTTARELKSEILAQKTNYVFTYRAEWREDFLRIVYIPSLKEFVCFARGY